MEEKQKEEKLMDSDSKENMRYYKEAYERERQKSRVLAAKLAEAVRQIWSRSLAVSRGASSGGCRNLSVQQSIGCREQRNVSDITEA